MKSTNPLNSFLVKTLSVISILFLAHSSFSQTYETQIEKCKEPINTRFDPTQFEKQFNQFRTCVIGTEFIQFQTKTISDRSVALSDFKGKIVLINTWFIGCPPCMKEIPLFNELKTEFEKDLVILSFGRDSKESILNFIKRQKMNFEVIPDAEYFILNKLKMTMGYPTNIFLDRDGKIMDIKIGGATDSVGLVKSKKEFQELIKSGIVRE